MDLMTAPRRLLAAGVGMSVVAGFALLLWQWLPGPRPMTAPAAVDRLPGAPGVAAAAGRARQPLPPPRLRAVAGGAGGTDEGVPAMPEGLAQDLEMFDGTQLRAELESLALSYPEVRVGEAVCSGLPCRAEATSASVEQLNGFTLAVHRRFQGHVSIRTQRIPTRDPGPARPLVRATFWVGTTPSPSPEPFPRP
jgi:hypothetical protein